MHSKNQATTLVILVSHQLRATRTPRLPIYPRLNTRTPVMALTCPAPTLSPVCDPHRECYVHPDVDIYYSQSLWTHLVAPTLTSPVCVPRSPMQIRREGNSKTHFQQQSPPRLDRPGVNDLHKAQGRSAHDTILPLASRHAQATPQNPQAHLLKVGVSLGHNWPTDPEVRRIL